MQTECNADLLGFARVEGRAVVAGFDGGRITSDAGALLLGATDRAVRLAAGFSRGLPCWRGDMKIWSTTTGCPPPGQWGCWRESCRPAARIVRRWPARARSIV